MWCNILMVPTETHDQEPCWMNHPDDPSPRALHRAFFDADTFTVSYLVWDAASRIAAVIDPVLGYDPKSGRIDERTLEPLLACIASERLEVQWLLETHAHADHLSGAQRLRQRVGGRIAIGAHIRDVQRHFKGLFNLGSGFEPDGRQFDHLFADGESFHIGGLRAQALWVPGHTPADLAYVVGDLAFVGDTIFMPDVGTARTDFPGGSARTLYRSIRRLLDLPPDTTLMTGHDYPPPGRGPRWAATVADQRLHNIHVHDGIDEAAFVRVRQARDATLEVPRLILPSIQVNVRAGELPPAEDNGVRYLKIPLDKLPARAA
jgi:glyoxylase-like metal-dependent hydrolase (beta-lactamase superfamily II)